MNRNVVIAGGVVLFHAALLWALQTGLLRRAVEIIVPAQILSEIIAPAPPPAPPPPQPRPQPQITPAVRPAARQPVAPPAPQPLAIADPTPTPQAPIGVLTPQPLAPPITTPVALAPAAPPAPPAPPRIVLPSSDADYLANPRPAYPPLSKRLGEQGKVVVRVLIGTDGGAQKAEIRTSSGFDRLDQAALATVQRWRYVPGKRDGVPEAMWFNVPINFVLE
ncbi:MAG: energy transducer TonB [Burkholderiaceae bacterium]|nr:energy transducer TonB [Burkholderiaceae bacterium]